ncbi:hypothetical protein O9X98_06610 [Agrobacterium salinitolerans]|nr:hypothetical protein [Agrobacterium salinitolerans]
MPRRLNMLSDAPLTRLDEAQVILRDELAGNHALAEAIEELIDAKLEQLLNPGRAAARVGCSYQPTDGAKL